MHQYRYLLISVDVIANTLSEQYVDTILVRLYAYLFQDLSLLFSLLLLLLQFFREDILRARILGRVIGAHWHLLAVSLLYLVLTVSWQTLHSLERPHLLKVAHCLLQRLVAVLYYFALAKPISLSKEILEKM